MKKLRNAFFRLRNTFFTLKLYKTSAVLSLIVCQLFIFLVSPLTLYKCTEKDYVTSEKYFCASQKYVLYACRHNWCTDIESVCFLRYLVVINEKAVASDVAFTTCINNNTLPLFLNPRFLVHNAWKCIKVKVFIFY